MVNGKVTADLKDYNVAFPWATEAVKFAVGGEYRQEFLFVDPDYPYQYALGAGSGGPTLPVSGSYNVKEFFAEGLIPLVQDARGAKDLSMEVGYRLSDYTTTGRWPTYKVQGNWAPAPDLKVRAGFNRATRSPNVSELFTPQGLGLNGSQDICAGETPSATRAQCALQGVTAAQYGTISENPAGQYNTFGGGNPDLQPEVADTYTLGVVVTPRKAAGFNATLDYYKINITDTIGSLGADDIQNQCAATGNTFLCGLIHRDRAGTLWLTTDAYTVTTNQNVGKLGAEGLDITGGYSKSIGSAGLLSFNLIGSYLVHESVDTGLYAYDCKGYFGNQCGVPTPSWRHFFRASWETSFKTTFSVGWRLIGGVTNDDGSPNPALADAETFALEKINKIDKIPTFNYIDLAVVYKLAKNYTLSFGIDNLFDKEPPFAPGSSVNDYGAGFYNTYDSLGRYIFGGIQFTF